MINVTIGESKTQKVKPFPKLMKCTGDSWAKGSIVFFISPKNGIRLTSSYEGDMSNPAFDGIFNSWDMSNFTDYNEPITLQNA